MPIPSGVALIAQLEGEAQGRGSTKRLLTQPEIDWDQIEHAVRDAIMEAEGNINAEHLKRSFAEYNLIVIDQTDLED